LRENLDYLLRKNVVVVLTYMNMQVYQCESSMTDVETFLDLVGDTTGPLTELYNLDKG
jgi:hypothetical protein